MGDKSNAPIGVKIISIYSYILVAVGLFGGILSIWASYYLSGFFSSLNYTFPTGIKLTIGEQIQYYFLSVFKEASFVILGVICIVLAIFYFFVARGLWKGQNWARIAQIIFGILGMLISILIISLLGENILYGITGLIIPLAIVFYLIFNQEVKDFFS